MSRVVVRGGELQDRTARNGKRLCALASLELRRGAGPRATEFCAGLVRVRGPGLEARGRTTLGLGKSK